MQKIFITLLLATGFLLAGTSTLYDSLFVRSTILDSALLYLNSSRKDLNFPVNTADYPLVFPLMDQMFKNQLLQVQAAENFAAVCKKFPNPDFTEICREFKFSSPALKPVCNLQDFLISVKEAADLRDSAWISCTAAEKELIINFFKNGQSYSQLQKNKPDNYSFKQDDLGKLFAERIYERESWQVTHDFYSSTMTKVKPEYLIKSGILLYHALTSLQISYLANPSLFANGTTETGFGRIAIGTAESDNYHGSYLLIIDPAGNDLYNLEESPHCFQFIIDLSGDDHYLGEKSGPCSAFNGTSLLFDLSGNDSYLGKNSSCSAAILGFSALIDYQGNDLYSAENFGQAAAALGFACLWDQSGNDRYIAASQAQGYAGCYGISVLCDENGNDSYLAVSQQVDELRYADHFNSMSQGFAIGERDHSGGGIAILCDRSGNDLYQSDIFGQGAGYWLAFGALLDYDGHDSYLSHQYTQGAGVHLAFGTLLDYHGNDIYRAKGVSMGSGHDYAGGVLVDAAGDDSYLAESLSIGSGNANGLSIFFDISGSDLYDTREKNCLGYSDWRRDTGYLGIFVDNGGIDRYTALFAGNKRVWYNGTWGAGIDK